MYLSGQKLEVFDSANLCGSPRLRGDVVHHTQLEPYGIYVKTRHKLLVGKEDILQMMVWESLSCLHRNQRDSDADTMSTFCNNAKTVNFLETGAFDGNKYMLYRKD